jgi:hypothetical protein
VFVFEVARKRALRVRVCERHEPDIGIPGVVVALSTVAPAALPPAVPPPPPPPAAEPALRAAHKKAAALVGTTRCCLPRRGIPFNSNNGG